MNFLIILVTALIILIIMRIGFTVLYWVLCRVCKVSNNTKFYLSISIFFLFGYIQGLVGATEGVLKNNNLSNLDWYCVYTFIGISMILWCYFDWEPKLGSMPKFSTNNKQIAVKKIFVFLGIMLFSLYYGYEALNKVVDGKEIDVIATITNATIVPGVIALDRVLNQLQLLRKKESKKI